MSNSLLIKFRHFSPQIWQQTVRHRGKFNVKVPHPRHDIARYLEEITKPVLIREVPDVVKKCTESKNRIAQNLKFSTKEAIDFEKFLAGYALNLIEKHEVMLICHKLNCPGETFRRSKVELKKNDTTIWNFNTVIMNLLMENDPKYQNLYPIVNAALGRNYYLFSQEKSLKKNLLLLRKMNHLVLLGGMIHGELMTKASVMAYIQMDDLDTQRSKLVATLNHQLASISTNLTSSTQSLSQALAQHSKSSE